MAPKPIQWSVTALLLALPACGGVPQGHQAGCAVFSHLAGREFALLGKRVFNLVETK